jgi:protein involved in polysaccharide export with SLBB domain
MRRVALVVGFALLSLAQAGCSTFGLSPPTHRLVQEAETFRDTNVPPPALPRELAKVPLAEYLVEPGDVLLVQTVDIDSPVRIPADQTILPDGSIELGDYGRPIVVGKTTAAIEGEIRTLVKAKEKKDVAITVRLIGRQSKVYYVLGEVNSPGSYPLAGRETVLDGIMAAGGLTRQAQERKVILVRPTEPSGCREVLPVCYPQIVQLGDTSTNYQLRPGDRIYVPSQRVLETLFPSRGKTTAPCCKVHASCYPSAAGACVTPAIPNVP